jgi:hypothetical protein
MSSVTEETKQSLPPGHPQAGYSAPAHDAVFATGTVPEVEQEWYDDRVEAANTLNEEIAEHEDDVAKAEAELPDEKGEKTTSKTSKPSTSASTSASSSGS